MSLLSLSLFLQKSAPSFVSSRLHQQKQRIHFHMLCSSSSMELDWDLHAVVRSYTSSLSSSSSSTSINSSTNMGYGSSSFVSPHTSSFGSVLHHQQQKHLHSSSSSSSSQDPLFEARNKGINGDLHELFKPFFHKSHPLITNFSVSPQPTKPISSSSSSSSVITIDDQLKQQQFQQQPQQLSRTVTGANATTPRSKRRKNHQKKICQVPAEALSSDEWAWRKYGQKPIKGSPYPRGYYRCSSSKGCLARKQVERSRSDPGMFIVTYTAEHNHPAPSHRNSLAGSTRQKPTVTGGDSNIPSSPKPSDSSPATSLDLCKHERDFVEEDEEVEFNGGDDSVGDFGGFSEAVGDDFFVGLENLDSPVAGECISDHFPASFGLPWLVNNTATATGGLL